MSQLFKIGNSIAFILTPRWRSYAYPIVCAHKSTFDIELPQNAWTHLTNRVDTAQWVSNLVSFSKKSVQDMVKMTFWRGNVGTWIKGKWHKYKNEKGEWKLKRTFENGYREIICERGDRYWTPGLPEGVLSNRPCLCVCVCVRPSLNISETVK